MSFLWFLSDLRTPAGDFFFQQITYLGQEIFVVAVICWLYWCVSKKSAYILGFSYFLSGLLIQALKITFRVPRPWKLDSSFKAVESALPEATGYSFPSGHTQSITALFGTLALSARKKWQTVLCFVIIFLVGFSRMYLGVHTPLGIHLDKAFCTGFDPGHMQSPALRLFPGAVCIRHHQRRLFHGLSEGLRCRMRLCDRLLRRDHPHPVRDRRHLERADPPVSHRRGRRRAAFERDKTSDR